MMNIRRVVKRFIFYLQLLLLYICSSTFFAPSYPWPETKDALPAHCIFIIYPSVFGADLQVCSHSENSARNMRLTDSARCVIFTVFPDTGHFRRQIGLLHLRKVLLAYLGSIIRNVPRLAPSVEENLLLQNMERFDHDLQKELLLVLLASISNAGCSQ